MLNHLHHHLVLVMIKCNVIHSLNHSIFNGYAILFVLSSLYRYRYHRHHHIIVLLPIVLSSFQREPHMMIVHSIPEVLFGYHFYSEINQYQLMH